MSEFYTKADAIAAKLMTSTMLSGIRMVVDRQLDIASELQKAIGRQTGSLIIIGWAGSKNVDESADGPRFVSSFTVTYCAKPVIRKDDEPADNIVEEIAKVLHDFRPNNNYHDRLVVKAVDPVPLGELILYRVSLSTPTQL